MPGADRDIFVSAGEVSGDHYIARMTRMLRERGFDGSVVGLCGEEASAAGAVSLWRAERLQLLGVSEVLGSLFDVLRLKREMTDEISRRSPRALILVDSPDFNIPLARALRSRGYRGRIFYISPPSVWAWRRGRVRYLKELIDENLPLFAFEHEYLLAAGCASMWVGHPLVDEFDGGERPAPTIKGAPTAGRVIAMLPGSRRSEISRLCPVLSEMCEPLERAGCTPVFSIAPGLRPDAADDLRERLERSGARYHEGPGRDLMAASDLVIGSSGTATAQALLLRKFMIVMYRVSAISALIGRLVLHNRFFAIPNLLADEMFYPELMQGEARADVALAHAMRWLEADDGERAATRAKMDAAAERMGRAGALEFWTDRVLRVA